VNHAESSIAFAPSVINRTGFHRHERKTIEAETRSENTIYSNMQLIIDGDGFCVWCAISV